MVYRIRCVSVDDGEKDIFTAGKIYDFAPIVVKDDFVSGMILKDIEVLVSLDLQKSSGWQSRYWSSKFRFVTQNGIATEKVPS